MKYVTLLLLLISISSCSLDNDDDLASYSFEVLPVENVDIPEEFTMGETYPITVYYYKPTTCHTFSEFYYYKENNERTVAPITYVYESSTCEDLEEELTEASFNFVVTSNGSYIFKFWQGENDEGEDVYLTIEVPVTE